MLESKTSTGPAQTQDRPFPWFCPRCRRKEVRRAVISHECPRLLNGQPISVLVANLSVPRCDNCGELVFDYLAEEQINQAFHAQTKALRDTNGSNQASGLSSTPSLPVP
jgi:hypothetical protein